MVRVSVIRVREGSGNRSVIVGGLQVEYQSSSTLKRMRVKVGWSRPLDNVACVQFPWKMCLTITCIQRILGFKFQADPVSWNFFPPGNPLSNTWKAS